MTAELEAQTARARRGGRRAVKGGAAIVVAAALVAAAAIAVQRSAGSGPAAASAARVATARVVRTDLTSTTQVTGELGFAGSVTVVGRTPGTAFTWLPSASQVIRRGRRLYEVDGRAVPLLFGRRPAWRTLSVGVLPGPDVEQLEANLVRLGHAERSVLTVDDRYTWQTAAAVRRWQTARGLTATGTVAPGDVAFAPGPLRVTSVAAQLGAAPQPGLPVLSATTTVRQVRAQLPVTLEHLVHAGDRVTVTLPDGSSMARGRVWSLGSVASAGAEGDSLGQGGNGPGSPRGTPATVVLRVRLRNPRAAGTVDAAPVTVNITSARARDVLAVPVSALVALAGGGYAVEVVDGPARRLVPVTTGLFAETRVQVSGPGLAPGAQVQVPAP